jgi:hypothetical protein
VPFVLAAFKTALSYDCSKETLMQRAVFTVMNDCGHLNVATWRWSEIYDWKKACCRVPQPFLTHAPF